MERYKVKTAATSSPITIADVKRNLRIATADTDTDRDALLTQLVNDAILASQASTGRQYCRATYTMYLDSWSEVVEITLGPVDAISTVKYYAPGEAVLTTLSSSKYQLDNSELTARLLFSEQFSVNTDRMNPIEIEFTNGYATVADVPADLKQAMILRACEAFLNPSNDQQISGKIRAAELKEENYKVQRY